MTDRSLPASDWLSMSCKGVPDLPDMLTPPPITWFPWLMAAALAAAVAARKEY